MDLNKFTCLISNKILDALKKIDANKSNFLIVLNEQEHVIATLTDYSIGNMFIPLVDVVFANCDYDSSEDFVKYCVDEYNNVSK